MIIAACVARFRPWRFFLIISCYWGSGLSSAPAWNAWISHIVPNKIRSRYFAKRTARYPNCNPDWISWRGWWLSYMQASNQYTDGLRASLSRLHFLPVLPPHIFLIPIELQQPMTLLLHVRRAFGSHELRLTQSEILNRIFGLHAGVRPISGPYFIPFHDEAIGLRLRWRL